jgi:hypothetical protein
MKKQLLVILAFVFFTSSLYSQNVTLHIPTNFQNSFKKGIRSFDGKPGINYWQNKANYKIKARLEPKTRTLSGEETVTYFNNSPDTLKQIVLRLYQDICKKGGARDFSLDPLDISNGTQIKKLLVEGNELEINEDKNSSNITGTNLFIPLKKQLVPKAKIEISLEWSFVIPSKAPVRMGTYDSSSFFIAYWYPQVAVYDDIDGWDVLDYTGQTEMYNDFNNYEVEISVPRGFLLWSTGVLQNPEEVFSKNILAKYNSVLQSEKIINVVDSVDLASGNTTSENEMLVYKIKAENVPDFVFSTSDHYLWDASTLVVDKKTGRKSFISAVYNKNNKYFSNVAEVAAKSIENFSTHMPAVPYPYPVMTVFNGQGGMEFPMMCNNSAVPDLRGTVHLTSHEICHTYFPFYMGTNERKYAWMDEGWAIMLPFDFQTENAPGYDPRSRNSQSYSDFAGKDTDVPLIIPSYNLKSPSYRTASYRRPGVAYEFLRQFLGDEIFLKALHEYVNRWNGKHPVPYDFFFTFDNVIGENLDWFWKPWFFENKYPDLSIENTKQENGSVKCGIKNIGGLPLPIILKAYFEDGSSEIIFEKNASVWKTLNDTVEVNISQNKKIVKLELGSTQIPDVDNSNNIVDM